MTSRQRLLAAFQCEEADRVPIIVRGVNPYTAHMNWRGGADASYRPLIERVRADCDVEHIWSAEQGFFLNGYELPTQSRQEISDGWQITYASVETPKGPLTFVSKVGIDNYSHAVSKPWITDEADVDRFLSLPFTLANPQLGEYWKAQEQIGERGYVLPNLNDPVGFVHTLLGSEQLALWSLLAPHLIRRLLDVMHERCMAYAEALLDAGVAPVIGLLGQEAAVPPLFSPRQFEDLVGRYNRPLIELIRSRGCLVYVHCHGSLDAVLERFADMGVNALHPMEAPPMGDIALRDAKQRVGDRVCLCGNIQIGDVMLKDRETTVSLVKQAIEEGAPGGGFVLTLSATPFERILSPRTLENLMAMIDTALEYGKS